MFAERMVKWGSNIKLKFLHKSLHRNLKTCSVFQTLLTARTMVWASEMGGLSRHPDDAPLSIIGTSISGTKKQNTQGEVFHQDFFLTQGRRCYGKMNAEK